MGKTINQNVSIKTAFNTYGRYILLKKIYEASKSDDTIYNRLTESSKKEFDDYANGVRVEKLYESDAAYKIYILSNGNYLMNYPEHGDCVGYDIFHNKKKIGTMNGVVNDIREIRLESSIATDNEWITWCDTFYKFHRHNDRKCILYNANTEKYQEYYLNSTIALPEYSSRSLILLYPYLYVYNNNLPLFKYKLDTINNQLYPILSKNINQVMITSSNIVKTPLGLLYICDRIIKKINEDDLSVTDIASIDDSFINFGRKIQSFPDGNLLIHDNSHSFLYNIHKNTLTNLGQINDYYNITYTEDNSIITISYSGYDVNLVAFQ
jgi:hypothetical protein